MEEDSMNLDNFKSIVSMFWATDEDIEVAFSLLDNIKYTKFERNLIYKMLPLKVKQRYMIQYGIDYIRLSDLKPEGKDNNKNTQEIINYIKSCYYIINEIKYIYESDI